MNISDFFIKRPIFAGVISSIIFLVGAISLTRMPVSEYPEVAPPTVIVRADYPGANPKTISETVAAPLEQSINGVENSLYMFSQATSDGVMTLTVTFKLGTNLDTAQVQVQDRVAQVEAKLPEEVRRIGVTTAKSSPDLLMVVHLYSPNKRYEDIYVRNYATLQVRDTLARLPGVGEVPIYGSGDYAMRVWLDPNKVSAKGLTASDVVAAIREQNVQVAAGSVGKQPGAHSVDTELLINTKGRLSSEEEFGAIIVKTGPNGERVELRDVARVELGASDYALRSLLNNKAAVALPILQLPGSNAIATSDAVRATMKELRKNFPDGLDYDIVYDPTIFVRHSIEAVVHTLLEAILLVVLVVILFLQTWRASIIPLAAVPVSLVGTFAVMNALGFSINALSLFGLVLAIGIVVDDAIVVVENVERNIALGKTPLAATSQAMKEVTGPIVATALVLTSVFIPTAFITGLTGQFYKQFAITIAISTVISAFNSLTLSPALSALLLKGHSDPKDALTRGMDRAFGWLFRPFNRFFAWASHKYSNGVARLIRVSLVAVLVYAGLLATTGALFRKIPTGFIPIQDKQYLVAFAQLPGAASLDRTDAVIRRMTEIALRHPGVESAVEFPGLSINGFTNSPNSGILFVTLKPFEERTTKDLSGPAIAGQLQGEFGGIQDAYIAIFPPPPVQGLGTIGGFKLYVEDRGDNGLDALFNASQGLVDAANQTPGLAGIFTSFTIDTPQLDADVDRVKAKEMGVPLANVFETMQINLGSLYINDFNRFGRTYQVVAQADAQFREHAEDIVRLKTRNIQGGLVPLGALVKVRETYGADRVMRYNGYPAADINGGAAPGYSSGQAEAIMEQVAKEKLPKGMVLDWTELTFQKIIAGNSGVFVYPISILLVFLVLAAQYESFRLPLAVIMIVPTALFSALLGLWLTRGENNIFTQIGLIVLIGLAAKNAILIVEFAVRRHEEGEDFTSAALDAARLRLRPILMTSIAFIAGVFPLVVSTGAGSEMRRAMGIAVFGGMIGVTFFSLYLTPVFYVVLEKLGFKKAPPSQRPRPPSPPERRSFQPQSAIAMKNALFLILTASTALASIPAVGPDYKLPETTVPPEYRYASTEVDWKSAAPSDGVPMGQWWALFGDSTLNSLEDRALSGNQDLRMAVARVEQAFASAGIARAAYSPQVALQAAASRSQQSATVDNPYINLLSNDYSIPVVATWELDLFGRVRRLNESAKADAEASASELESVRLSLSANVAATYFTLRGLDREIAILKDTASLRLRSLDLISAQYRGGVATELDTARAETELAIVNAETHALEARRESIQGALAVLVGDSAVTFSVPPATIDIAIPAIPAGVPSELLERRPDVASAERRLAAANARIGVAKAAFFPAISLTGSAGFESGGTEHLFGSDSRIWAFGPSIYIPIFQGGRNRANLDRAKGVFDENVAAYRQQVLEAFDEVQDSLASTHILAEQALSQDHAVKLARQASQLAKKRYNAGYVSYLDVVEADRTELESERSAAQLESQRLNVAVALIKALGGDWWHPVMPSSATWAPETPSPGSPHLG